MPSAKLAGTPTVRPGNDVQAREQVMEVQRVRILAAMVGVVSDHGVGNATVARVVARSGVSRRTFYELFEDREDCFLAAFDETISQILMRVVPAYERPGSSCMKTRAALTALLEFFDCETSMCRLVIVETLGAGPRALERRRDVLCRVIEIVDQSRGEAKGEGPPSLTAEGIVGGVFSMIHTRLLTDREAALIEMVNPLMSMIVLPYLGPAAARRELAESPPTPTPGMTTKSNGDPLRDLDMRLTYRTMRVLLAIAALPHASNRQIADASEIRDQGQISKLLARLEHLDLIENTAGAKNRGGPNRWTLTPRGRDVHRTISL